MKAEQNALVEFQRLSQAERDAAYNNAAAVADSAAWLARWASASARLRAARAEHLDLAYGGRERNRWDLFPAGEAGAPCLVFIHGGYWQRNAKEVFACMSEGVVAHGWAAALPAYTLAPGASLSEIVAEIRTSLDWLAANGPAHGIAGPIVVSGWSAGGHLAAMSLDHPRVSAGLAISGVFDLAPLASTYLNDALRLTDVEIANLSPIRLRAVAKRFDIAYGTAELPALIGNSVTFHEHRRSAGAPGQILAQPGRNHFDVLEELRQPEGVLCRQLSMLVRGHDSAHA